MKKENLSLVVSDLLNKKGISAYALALHLEDEQAMSRSTVFIFISGKSDITTTKLMFLLRALATMENPSSSNSKKGIELSFSKNGKFSLTFK